jgi:hypothetical protein
MPELGSTKLEVICTLNATGVNIYKLLFAFRDQMVDATFERDGELYCISSIELSDNKIVAMYHKARR